MSYTVTEKPLAEDILSREIIFNHDLASLAVALLPWVRRNPYFSLLALIDVCGLKISETGKPWLLEKVQNVIRSLGCRSVGRTEHGGKVWHFPDKVRLSATHVTCRGYSENADEQPPQDFQISVAREWLRQHARPTKSITTKFSTDGLRSLVRVWTRETGFYKDVTQVNEWTGQCYKAPDVYITSGAMLQAALLEGYQTKRVPRTGHAWLNISWHKTGQQWRGPVPKPSPPKPPKIDFDYRKTKSTDLISLEVVKARLEAFLHKEKFKAQERVADGHYAALAEPHFRLKAAARAAQIPVGKGRAPEVLTRALKELGCESARLTFAGVEGQYWHRNKDMPRNWMPPEPRRVSAKRLAKKSA